MSGTRAFVALDLPSWVVASLEGAGDALRREDRRWRDDKWVEGRNLHITLKFLGSLSDEDVTLVRAALDVTIPEHGAARLAEPRIRAVPNTRRARMVWATFFDDDGTCAAVAEAAERAALRAGVAPEERPFVPHVTLARARRQHAVTSSALEAAQVVLDAAPKAVSVGEVTLYRSVLTRQGPVYEPLDVWRLGAR